jgi:hypothetical protein
MQATILVFFVLFSDAAKDVAEFVPHATQDRGTSVDAAPAVVLEGWFALV